MLTELRTKSQITIPKDIVMKMGLREGDKLEIVEKDGVIELMPVAVYPILKTHQLYVKMTLRREVVQLPVLSIFYGIIVRMYREQGGKHNMPHIHAEYSGEEIVVALDGTVLEGSFPKNKLKLLEAWIVIHHEDLEANWKLLSNGEQFFRIDPLK